VHEQHDHLRTSSFGPNGDHIQISPPLIASEAEIAIIFAALDDALFEAIQVAVVAGTLRTTVEPLDC